MFFSDNCDLFIVYTIMTTTILQRLVLVPDRQSDCKYDTITSTRSAKIAKHQLQNKAVEVVKNATGYKCAISPAITNDLNVVQIPKIYSI